MVAAEQRAHDARIVTGWRRREPRQRGGEEDMANHLFGM